MWNKVYFNSQNIEYTTGKATLIKMPKKSGLGGYKFWHPAKLVRNEGGKGYHKSFSFTEEFTFKLFKNGKGRDVIDEIELTYEEILEAFGAGSEAISIATAQEKESYLEAIEPIKVNKEVKVAYELLN